MVELRDEGGFYSVVTAFPKENPAWKPSGERILGGRRAAFAQSERAPGRTAQEPASPKLPLEPLPGKDSWEYIQYLSKPVKPKNESVEREGDRGRDASYSIQKKITHGEDRGLMSWRKRPMKEMFPQINPEDMVHFSSGENMQSVEENGVLPNEHGYSHWFRFSEISHFSPDQVSALIGNLAHDDIAVLAVAESGAHSKVFRKFGAIPGTGATVTDYEAMEPVPVRTFPLKKSDK